MAIHLRPIQPEEIPAAVHLVGSVFNQCVAPQYGPDGIKEFTSYASPDAFTNRLLANHVAFVAVDEAGAIVGLIEIREHRHISLLFVETHAQRRGIGRRLVETAVEACKELSPELTALTVHASPNSVDAYERFGFFATEPEQEKNGIRFVPMALSIRSPGGT